MKISERPMPGKTKNVARPVNFWMMMSMIAGGGILLVAAIIGLLLVNQSANNTGAPNGGPLRVGQQMADFTLQDIQGKTVSLSDYKGHPVLINAWATWCPPCRAEMPDLNAFYQKYRSNGFIILAVNAGETQSLAADFASQNKLQFPVLLDPDEKLMDQLNIHDYPTSIVVGKDGRIKTVHVGMLTPDAIQREILPLIQ